MPITEENVIDELRAHNQEALSFLIQQFATAVSALAWRILTGVGTSWGVEECVSDVFARAWNQADAYDEQRGSVRTWLLVMTKYQALEQRRKLSRRRVELGEQVSVGSVESNRGVESTLATVLSRERQQEITTCIREMEQGLREVFIRRYLLQLSPGEIAQELGISRSAVDNRLWRGRRWLRDRLLGLEKGGDTFGVGTTR